MSSDFPLLLLLLFHWCHGPKTKNEAAAAGAEERKCRKFARLLLNRSVIESFEAEIGHFGGTHMPLTNPVAPVCFVS